MATMVGLTKIWITQFDWPTPKTPVRCKNLGPILNASWVMVNFVWKFQNFCYYGNRGCLTQISLTQLNRPTSKPPIWCKNLDDISYTSWVMADFLLKFANFCYHDNKDGSNKNLEDSVWLAYPQTPTSVQKSGTYLKCKLSYGKFCVKISKFLLPWQQG